MVCFACGIDPMCRLSLYQIPKFRGLIHLCVRCGVHLPRYRLWKEEFEDSPCFGVNLVADRPGSIRVGDPVYATLKEG